jgi:hypothetical protein
MAYTCTVKYDISYNTLPSSAPTPAKLGSVSLRFDSSSWPSAQNSSKTAGNQLNLIKLSQNQAGVADFHLKICNINLGKQTNRQTDIKRSGQRGLFIE